MARVVDGSKLVPNFAVDRIHHLIFEQCFVDLYSTRTKPQTPAILHARGMHFVHIAAGPFLENLHPALVHRQASSVGDGLAHDICC